MTAKTILICTPGHNWLFCGAAHFLIHLISSCDIRVYGSLYNDANYYSHRPEIRCHSLAEMLFALANGASLRDNLSYAVLFCLFYFLINTHGKELKDGQLS